MGLRAAARSLLEKVRDARERHRERHRPTEFGFAFADRIDYLDAQRWDALTAGGTVFLGRRYRRLLEETSPPEVQHRYALVFRGDEPVAAVAAQLVALSAARLAPATVRGARASAAARLQERLLVCGNLFSWGQHGVAFAPGEEPAGVWPGVAEALYRLRRADQLRGSTDFVMVKDLPEAEARAASVLRRCSYRPLETEPDMVLALSPEWRSLQDYFAGLRSTYRKAARVVEKEVAEAGYTLERLTDLQPEAPRLHALYLQVHAEAKMRLATLTPAVLPALAATFGEDFRCSVLRRGGTIEGFVTTLKDGETGIGYYIGFDRAQNAQVPLYFRLLQAVVGDAIALGCRRLSLGRTALEPKARLGARPERLRVYVRHRVPALNVVVRSLLGAIPHEVPPERQALKG